MFKSAKKLFIALFSSAGIFAVAGFVLAAAPDLGLQFGDAIGLSNADPRVVASNIIRIALGFLGIIAVGLIVYGGFLWMTAAGNEDRIETAKKLLISAVIGLIIILSAFAIATYVLNRLLEATGNGSADGGPCSTSATSCAPSNALCQAGLTCGADCLCHGSINPFNPPVNPGGPCGTISFGVCTQTGNCPSDQFCATAGDCTCHPKTCSTSLDPAVCTVSLDPNVCGSGYYCDPTCACQANAQEGESCDGDKTTPACDGAIGLICDPNKNLFCDINNATKPCTCQPGDGEGQPCGTDPAACSAGNNLCSNQLVCDVAGAACTCQKAPVIDWVSPLGGLCSNDNNKECQADADCGGAQGVTCNLHTPSAAVGNIISIGGRYFGDTPGTVLFANGSGGTIAGQTPATVNAACVQYWSDSQVIIVVPSGAAAGPITVKRPDNKADTTSDSRGPKINDLQINTIVKPGLCGVNPGTGKLGAPVLYNGVNFAAASAAFGNYELSIPAKNSTQLSPKTVQAGVPSVVAGDTTTFVANASGQDSNYLEFTKVAEPNSGPYIASFDPQTGAPGQYVTIKGSGFGDSRGVNKVYFRAAADHEANYSFPDICADSVWGDKQVIVKVPDGLADGNYSLVIVFADGKEISTAPAVFVVNNALSLSPSLCKISPVLGQVGTTVDLWGEYFGDVDAANSKVRFSSKKDIAGFTSANWGLDTGSSGNPRPDKAETKVPNGAVSGGVSVVKGSPELAGNSLNFQVGSCLDASDGKVACGGQECCPAGTYKAGDCVANVSDCASAALTSVYEFDFNTNFNNNPNDFFGSCLERSKLLGTCTSGATCPNSPGACSLFPAGAQSQTVGACTDESCSAKKGCETAGSCVYNQSTNRCVANPPSACGLASTTRDIFNKEVPTYCAAVKDPVSSKIINRYVFDRSKNSCPPGWAQALNNTAPVCLDQKSDAVCAPCGTDLTCVPSGLSGVCAAAGDVCPSGSTCRSGACQKNPEASCGCCCRKANVNADCCAGLTCAGTCGSDAGGTDTNTYGSCGGCANIGTTVAEHDAACNCSGTTGKFCDLSDPNFTAGVCRDCAQLSNALECSTHNDTCCVDATKGQSCVNRQFGLGATDIFALVTGRGGFSYCGRYECVNQNPNLVVQPSGKSFNTEAEAAVGCGPEPQIGASCATESTPAKPASDCNKDVCNDARNIFSCLTDSGAAGAFLLGNNESCGVCCCNPADDKCSTLGDNPNLHCQSDVGPNCTGSGRGLCCGCSANTDCGDATKVGCASDSCCRARPGVESTAPADGATGVCTNGELRASFDQLMDTESFSGNVVVVGDYFSDTCPAGTAYLAANGVNPARKNIFARAIDRLRSFLQKPLSLIFGEESLASEKPVPSDNYCAIAGSVGSEQEAGKTILTFRPTALLKADEKYFMIIKGDADLKNSRDSVRSLWNIGMNIITSPVDNTYAFNGIIYQGAYIWSFTTLPDTTANPKGLCAVDHAKIVPDSYLIQTTDNDKNENDSDSANKTFDTVADSDKSFAVQALSRDNQVLHPVSGYDWKWNWDIENKAVADFVSGVSYVDASGNPITDVSKQLIRAIAGVTDNRTKANAVINMTAPTPALDVKASADIHVFVCANPWPPVNLDGTWAPWIDMVGNCNTPGLSCNNFNYELYYCRDQGSGGPTADLPTISSALTWGEGNDALKESFFFREGVPLVDTIGLTATPAAEGGAVDLSWNAITDPTKVHTVVKYKVYFGDKSGELKANPQQPSGSSRALRIDGLQNGKTYYAAVTAVYENGAESAYSPEVSFTPKKSALPNTPTGLQAEVVRETVVLPITVDFDNAALSATIHIGSLGADVNGRIMREVSNFEADYGVMEKSLNLSVSASADEVLNQNKPIVLSDLAVDTPYYLKVSSQGGLGANSAEVKIVLHKDKDAEFSFVDPALKDTDFGLSLNASTNKINVSWTANKDDIIGYKFYYRVASGAYGSAQSLKANSTSFIANNAAAVYYLTVTALDKYGNESTKAPEVSIQLP